MLSPTLLIILSLALVSMLFAIAWCGDRRGELPKPWRSWVYTLSLAVYCTSWAFYGTINQAATHNWLFPPTYVGTLILFALGYQFMRRLHQLTRQHNITSIADFLAARFGKSRHIAVLVTIIASIAVLPYIALQLKAVASSYRLLSGIEQHSTSLWWQDTGLFVALLMAGFAMLFGTRSASVTEHQPGLMLAVAFESLFKLIAFVGVGGVILWHWDYQPINFFAPLLPTPAVDSVPHVGSMDRYLTLTVLGICAMFCLPRQFYVGFVECRGAADLAHARWTFPLYLILMGLFTLPVAQIGLTQYGLNSNVDAETYLLRLPLDAGFNSMALLAYLGGFAAATSMVILSSVALSIMISNELLLPWWLKWSQRAPVLMLRRLTILVILFMAWLYYRHIGESEALAAMGGIAFAGAAQFAPAIILGVYWPALRARAVSYGLGAGFLVWLWTLVIPIGVEAQLLPTSLLQQGPLDYQWLNPQALFFATPLDSLSHGTLWSLLANIIVLLLAQFMSSHKAISNRDGMAFLQNIDLDSAGSLDRQLLSNLLERFLGSHATQKVLKGQQQGLASRAESRAAERALAGVLGTASARSLLRALGQQRGLAATEVAAIVSQAGQVVRFNRELLDVVFAHISQGVSVVDDELRLVAWNQRYVDLFNYPPELLTPGRHIADLVRYNAERGWCGEGSIEESVAKRIRWMQQGTHHRFERQRLDGIVLEMHGQPLPGGGFVTTFNDVTEYKKTQEELEQLNKALEARVAERTTALASARDAAEQANLSKSRFLAATSHDLAQPLNAARLLVSTLEKRSIQSGKDELQLIHQLSQVLENAESLLIELQEMSRLERGLLKPNPTEFRLYDLFQQLEAEFLPLVQEKSLSLKVAHTEVWVLSDERMLLRILQNLLANAVRYTRKGGIVMGVRRTSADMVRVEVWDSGSGIEDDQRENIFEEFKRGENAAGTGLGLGLAITRRFAELMGHPLAFDSKPGQGSKFYLHLPRVRPHAKTQQADAATEIVQTAQQAHIYCIDNDQDVLNALTTWLSNIGYQVSGFDNEQDLLKSLDATLHGSQSSQKPQLIIADYHLARGQNGLNVIYHIRKHYLPDIPALIISADTSDALKQTIAGSDVLLMSKPVKPLALQSTLNRLL